MKHCPKCKEEYDDESLNFCLSDGTPLVEIRIDKPEDVTVEVRKAPPIGVPVKEAETVVIPPARETQNTPSNPIPGTRKTGGNSLVIGILIAILLFVSLGFVGFIAYTLTKKDESASASLNSNKENQKDKTLDLQSDKDVSDLKDEIEKLKEQIGDQKDKKTEAKKENTKQPPPGEVDDAGENLGRVNSPNDGFLALRNIPNHKTGIKLIEIPHGTRIQILGCQNKRIAVNGVKGRWCRTYYKDKRGWVFDAWIDK